MVGAAGSILLDQTRTVGSGGQPSLIRAVSMEQQQQPSLARKLASAATVERVNGQASVSDTANVLDWPLMVLSLSCFRPIDSVSSFTGTPSV